MSTPAIANLRQWRQQRTRTIALTSGLVLTQRRDAQVYDLLAGGSIPIPVLQKLMDIGALTAGKEGAEAFAAMGEDLPAMIDVVNAVACAVCLSPRVLSVADYAALIQQAATALSVAPEQVIAWLGEEAGEAHMAGLPAALQQQLATTLCVRGSPFDDRRQLFSVAMEDATPATTFPAAA